MVQKEVMKRTKTYGLIGLLLAIILVAMIYSYGIGTQTSSPTPPQPHTQIPAASSLQTFTSYNELIDFLGQKSASNIYLNVLGGNDYSLNTPAPEAAPATAHALGTTSTSSTDQGATNDYSTTNVQVAGVDEADTVKTDGQYLYVIGNSSQVVYILDAGSQNPQNAQVLSTISLSNSYLSGIYLSADGTKLAVLGSNSIYYNIYAMPLGLASPTIAFPSWGSNANFVYVYDVSNRANPVLTRNFTMSGNYANSRMIGNYVYDVIQENAYLLNGTALLPTVFSGQGQQAYNIAPTDIYYFNSSDSAYMYTTIVALNIQDATEAVSNTTILMGNAGAMYVSKNNIYLTDQLSIYQTTNTPTSPSSGGPIQSGTAITPGAIVMPTLTWQGTSIYRILISNSSLTFAAKGSVTGTVMNQYSMDEYNGYFRIATTSYDYSQSSYIGTQQNNLYILNSDLKLVGQIQNLASGEALHSARFIGDRCYLVTFNQIDPLFVVDLSQPANPQVLGNLTIPGYSDFLQPYDATHLIGIGQDVNASIDAGKAETPGDVYYTAVLGLKVSLFDVGDVSNPKEISNIVIGDRGSTSEALTDPKAILFDASRNLLVLPVELYLAANTTTTSSGSVGDGTAIPAPAPMFPVSESYPQFVWQGAYIFRIDLANGITVKGNVTQLDNASSYLANPSLAITSSYPWADYQYFITRSLYIDNVLYTFSQSRVQLNSLSNFALLAKVELN